jgi:hypothetical protein
LVPLGGPVSPIPDSRDEDSPALTVRLDGTLELWSVGPAGALGGRDLRRRTALVLPSGAIFWSDPERVLVERRDPFGPAEPSGGAAPGHGLVVAPFLGRTQIYINRGDLFAALAHHAIGGPYPDGNFFDLRGRWERRPAVFEVVAPDGRPAQVLLTVGLSARTLPDQLVLQQRRSD